MILDLEHISGGYAKGTFIVKGVDLELKRGQVLAVIGQNGAGKSTLAKAIINFLPYREGKLSFKGEDVSHMTTQQLNQRGLVYYMQGGRVFNTMSVKENIFFSMQNKRADDEILSFFPVLKNHWKDEAATLSGGERHQLALAMTLVKKPELLILDEPSAGLSPVAKNVLYELLSKIRKLDVSIILIEQNVKNAVEFSDRVAVMIDGQINKQLISDDRAIKKVQEIYFGEETKETVNP